MYLKLVKKTDNPKLFTSLYKTNPNQYKIGRIIEDYPMFIFHVQDEVPESTNKLQEGLSVIEVKPLKDVVAYSFSFYETIYSLKDFYGFDISMEDFWNIVRESKSNEYEKPVLTCTKLEIVRELSLKEIKNLKYASY